MKRMAAEVEVQTGEVGRTAVRARLHLTPLTDSSNSLVDIPSINQSHIITQEPNKPVPGPKPRLTPKPFAVDRNPTIKPIVAPKPQPKPRPESTHHTLYKPEPPCSPKPQQPVAAVKPKPVSVNPNRPASTSFKTSSTLLSGQTTKPVAQPFKPAPPLEPGDPSKPTPPSAERQKPAASGLVLSRSLRKLPAAAEWSGTMKWEDDKGQVASRKSGVSITRAKSMGFLVQVGQEEEEETEKTETAVPLRPQPRGPRPRPVSAIFHDSPTKTETPVAAPRWVGRRPLSADLTSKFESIGLSLHRKTPNTDTKENIPAEKPLTKELQKTTAQSSESGDSPAVADQSKEKTEEENLKENNEHAGSIKSRIDLLLDSSSTPGSELHSPVQPVPESEPAVGVKQLIKQLTEDTTPTQSPTVKPPLKPRPLPLDLTKRFSSERSPDIGSVSLTEATDRHDISKDPQKRIEESSFTPSDQRIVAETKDSQEHLKKLTTLEGPEAGQMFGASSKESGNMQTVRASLFENVVERHSVLMVNEGSPSFKKATHEDAGTLVTATYKEPMSPSSPLRMLHAFDTVQAVEESRVVSENIPSAQRNDKAVMLHSKRSDGSRPSGEPTSSVMPEQQPRYLRVGALQKWNTTGLEQEAGLEKGILKESRREVAVDKPQEQLTVPPKCLQTLQVEEQPKPRATYFALTGQIQAPFSPIDAGASTGDSAGKVLPVRRDPSFDEPFGELMAGNCLLHGEIRSVLEGHAAEEMKEFEKKKKETERQKAKPKGLEKEKQLLLEMEKDAYLEFERMKEREMQREFEIQRQKAYEKEKQEFEEKQRALERQKQLELEKQKLQELEREKLEKERQQQLEKDKQRRIEKERRREQERQRLREEERQRELDRERQLLELQNEKKKREAIERLKELERVQLLELHKEKQKAKERHQLMEQKIREKEREEAEKIKQMALEQEMLRMREIEKERERQREMEKERQKEMEREKQRELERQRQLEKERERQLEMEKERQKEIEREKQRELERQRFRDLERERQRQLDIERQELENQRLRQREVEKERQRMEEVERIKEMESRQLLEFDKQKREREREKQVQELEKRRLREKMEREESEKMRQVAKQQEAERQRLKEKQKKEEQERARLESSALRPQVVDLDSVLRNEPLPKASPQWSDPATRWREPFEKPEESYKPAILDIDSFSSLTQPSPGKDLLAVVDVDTGLLQPERDVSWKGPLQTSVGFTGPVWTTSPQDPWELRPVEMSVDKPVTESRKHTGDISLGQLILSQEERFLNPQRHHSAGFNDTFHLTTVTGIDARVSTSGDPPAGVTSSAAAEQIWFPREPQHPNSREEVRSHRRSQGSQELSRMRSRSMSRRSAPSGSTVDINPFRMRSRSAHREQDRHGWVQQSPSGEEEGKNSPARDTDSQYGTWETGLRTDDSLTPATPSSESNLSPSPRKSTPPGDTPGSQVDTLDSIMPSSSPEKQPLSFPDAPVALLDTSALRSKAQLGKKRTPRTRPSRAARQSVGLTEENTDDWLFRDSTEVKVENVEVKSRDEEADFEEVSRGADKAASSQPQRVALFPKVDPSALMAQLKKRGNSDNQNDGPTSSPSEVSRSPKSPFLPRAARVLPPPGGKENGEEDSPQWLKELKSKKRLSQYESES